MALEVRLVLDTDTPENMRIITNDNLKLIVNQINQFLNYLNSDFGTLTGLSNLESSELKVNTNKLVVTPSNFIINDNVELNGDINLSGNLISGNINTVAITSTLQEVIDNGGEYNIGSTSSYPPYSTYMVSSTDPSGLTINLFPAAQGQELILVMVNDPSGVETLVKIQKSSSGTAELYLPSGQNFINLDEIGETVRLKYIDDGWYILSNTGGYSAY